MADSIKAVLAETTNGSKVVIAAEDIRIIQDGDDESRYRDRGIEGDRLKALGDFQVEVRVKGGEAVVRTVCVKETGGQPGIAGPSLKGHPNAP